MWTTKTVQRARGFEDVHLFRDEELIAIVPKDDWWIASATELLANEALKAEDLNFKARDVQGEGPEHTPRWTTDLTSSQDGYDVHLLCDLKQVIVMRLDEWAELPVTESIVLNIVEAAENLSNYGDDIEEVRAALKGGLDDSE